MKNEARPERRLARTSNENRIASRGSASTNQASSLSFPVNHAWGQSDLKRTSFSRRMAKEPTVTGWVRADAAFCLKSPSNQVFHIELQLLGIGGMDGF